MHLKKGFPCRHYYFTCRSALKSMFLAVISIIHIPDKQRLLYIGFKADDSKHFPKNKH